MNTKTQKTKKLVMIAMLCAVAYVVMVIGRVPVVLFLKYDPKDVIIALGGFIFGPLSAFAISAVVSILEALTTSDTGPIGLVMNVISSCSFACVAALVYRKKHTKAGAIWGLVAGWLAMTATMLLWNYLITPLYMGVPRQEVAGLLLPAFLPFNLLKGGLNTAATLVLYKPLVTGLRRAGLLPESQGESGGKWKLALPGLLLLATCVVGVLVMQGVI